ncbi:tetratricopeptide repeat protein [Vibrio mediterranei]
MDIRGILVYLVTIFLFGCVSSSTPSNQDIVNSMERVDNHDGLIQHYKGHLQNKPEDNQITQELAKVYFDKGDIESAQFYTDHLLNDGVQNWQLAQLRGQIHDKMGENSYAETRYKQSLKLGNTSSDIHVLLGITYSKQDKFNQAEQEFNTARLKGHNDLIIKNNLAVVYLAKGDYFRVTQLLTPVFKENPSNQVVKANLAIAFFKLGRIDQARELLNDEYSDSQVSKISRQLYKSDG